MTLFGIRLRVHPLAPLMLALGFVFSGGARIAPALIALGLHESVHMFTAIKLKTKIDEIELMPFGAAIRLYELWETSPRRLVAITLSAPIANILAAGLLMLPIYAYPKAVSALLPLIKTNLVIGLVNLIPALPLDGGRALAALLGLKIGRYRAVIVFIWVGRVLALALILGFVCVLLFNGHIELMLLCCGVYVFAAGERERRQSEGATLRAVLLTEKEDPDAAYEVRWLCVGENASIYATVRAMQSGVKHIVAVRNAEGSIMRILSQSEVLDALTKNSAAPILSVGTAEVKALSAGDGAYTI